ncbi:class I SAM-dependent methyltransferase [Pseudomonas sp. Marseille-Q5115]|uniref:class I SAM-dependent methyltransferase n=1 Tax=Pseudomonas sp. Marseille-Q5115 TaxID=2866593 RepID=UPI001CE40D92|nr:class I SAM-dependent methyltransferase [Pseudomonas sp. Marseille-Q5115]
MKTVAEFLHLPKFHGFSLVSDTYDQGRPGYPPEIKKWLTAEMEIKNQTAVLDLGAGTGKFTRLLVDLHANVTAVEPEPSMAERFHKTLPGITLLSGTADEIPLPSQSMNAVVCAQSFHLFASEQSMREIHRVLKPGGHLGLFWNVRDASVGWVHELAEIVNEFAGDHPRYYDNKWREPLNNGIRHGYAPLKEATWKHLHTGSPEDVIVRRIKSISFIAAAPEPQKTQIMERVRKLIAEHPELAGKAEISVPYETRAVRTVKILP